MGVMGSLQESAPLSGLRGMLDPDPEVVLPPDTRPAAVLLPMIDDGAGPSIVFTKRAEDLSRHRGEISFPGGLRHIEDGSLEETALRETEEELGLPRAAVEILGALEPVHTFVSGILIVPYVGLLTTRPAFTPSPAEIAEVLEYPVVRLAASETLQRYEHELGTWFGFAYLLDENTIWGATGRILHGFLDLLRKEAPWLTRA
jgi:8-oxo-dGTP pyrophosphatase MutT (NUDIX family)